MQESKVVVKQCKQYDEQTLSSKLKDGFDLLGGLGKFIKSNTTVLIKPDLYMGTHPDTAKTTHPNIVSALAEIISKIGAKCIIADSPKGNYNQSNLDNVYMKTQMLQASNNGYASLNSNESICVVNNPTGEYSRDIYLIDAINDADVIINVGKFRCYNYLGLVGCSQNIFGLVPGQFKELIKSRCYKLKSYYNYLIDLNEVLEDKIVLNVLDAIVSCEANDDPRILNSLLIGDNPYAVDSVALQIINQDAKENLLINESVRRNKFNHKVEILGDDIQSLVCSDYNYTKFLDNIKSGGENLFKCEYKLIQKRPVIATEKCKGCKMCASNCPMKAIGMQTGIIGQHAEIDYNKCITCFKCVESCPYKVITTKKPIKYKAIDKMIKKHMANQK